MFERDSQQSSKNIVVQETMLAFALALFPVTGIFGAGQFVLDKGFQSWLGWSQLATLIGQVVVLYLLRQSILDHTDIVDANDVMCEPATQYLTIVALVLLLLGVGQYTYGVWRTFPVVK